MAKAPYLRKKATPWVSNFVLLGCMAITIILWYATDAAYQIASGWVIPN